MTKGECLDWLYRLRGEIYVYIQPKEWLIPMNNALDMAIKALEQEPCEDAINRQAAIDAIWDGVNMDIYTREVKECLEKLPSVNAEKTGHWVGIDEKPHEDYECDKCGYAVSTFTANIEPHTEYKYCPNCGARMLEQ